jgi:hypothetical protein
MEEKEGSARMSGLRRRKPNEEFNFKIAFCGYNSMIPDSVVKWYAIVFLDQGSRPCYCPCRHCHCHCHCSSSARKKEKENVDVSTNKKLIPYSSSSAKNSPNQVLTPFLVVERDLSVI